MSPKSPWKPLFATSCISSGCWLRVSHTISSPGHMPLGQCERNKELFVTSFPGCLRRAELEFRGMDTNSSYLTWSQSKSYISDVYIRDTWGIPCGRVGATETRIAMLRCLLACSFPHTNGWREMSILSTSQTIWRPFEQHMRVFSTTFCSPERSRLLDIHIGF